jgi:hypothetical protein
MIPCKFPLSDLRRQNLKDDQLWVREVQRLTFFNLRKMHCPCSKCQGRRKLLVRTVREHLILKGRDPNFRVWKDPGATDSSDEEWEGHMRTCNQQLPVELDSQVDTRDMVDNAFLEEPLLPDVEEIVHDVVTSAFDLGDVVHEECNDSLGEGDAANLSEHGVTSCKDVEGHETSDHFDPTMLEEAIQELYEGSRNTKLAATILLMNLCTVHGVSNNFVDELFTILHHHLLPEGNRLPKNHYAAKSLTSMLGLTYTSITHVEKVVFYLGMNMRMPSIAQNVMDQDSVMGIGRST